MADPAIVVDAAAGGSPPPEPAQPATTLEQREYAMVPLARIRLHPLNLRKELRNLEELADSVRQDGLLEPVLLVPDPERDADGNERFLLVAGHRRHAACVMAKHDPVEAIIRYDLDSEGVQVLTMLTENGPRDDLTAIEEAHGYQLALALNHLTPARLAKRLGKPKDRITTRIALTKLPDHVQEQVHTHQISLQEAEAMVEFASDTVAIGALLRHVGKQSFQYNVEQQRQRREAELRIAAVRRQLHEAGVRVIERPHEYPWRSTEKPVGQFIDPAVAARPDGTRMPFTAETHAGACSLHAAFINPYDCKPEYVCANPAEAGHEGLRRTPAAPTVAPPADDPDIDVAGAEAERLRQSEEERQRLAEEQEPRTAEEQRAQAERREALEVAARLRHTFLTTLVRRSGRAHLQAVLQLLLTENFQAWLTEAELEDAQELAILIDAKLPDRSEGEDDEDQRDSVVANLRAALSTRRTPDAIVGALLAIVGHDREWALAQGHGWGDASCRRYMDFLVAQGCGPIELEEELLRDVEVRD